MKANTKTLICLTIVIVLLGILISLHTNNAEIEYITYEELYDLNCHINDDGELENCSCSYKGETIVLSPSQYEWIKTATEEKLPVLMMLIKDQKSDYYLWTEYNINTSKNSEKSESI